MCGIFGIWNLDGQLVEPHVLKWATNRMRHRGPDDEGYLLVDPKSGDTQACAGKDTDTRLKLQPLEFFHSNRFSLAFGFRRLAILDLTPLGHQPMTSENARYSIVFNGEIYNYKELRNELLSLGYTFRSNTDTEVVLVAYQHWGQDCLTLFNGMWAFAIWDSKAKILFLARDRFGIKPLYYTWQKNVFTFASEIKALVGLHGIPFEPDPSAFNNFLTLGIKPDPQNNRTFFSDVNSLPPGCAARVTFQNFEKKDLEIYRFWKLEVCGSDLPQSSLQECVEEYRAIFDDAVRLRLQSDVPVGTCLSGGLDSSSIVSTINHFLSSREIPLNQLGPRQHTFSSVYTTQAPYNERNFIEMVLAQTQTEKNFTFPTNQGLQNDLERLLWHQDEPFSGTSIYAQWCVMKLVQERSVKVLLDGQGADEVLAGYRPFCPYLADYLRHGAFSNAVQEMRAISHNTDGSGWPYFAMAIGSLLPLGIPDFLQSLLRPMDKNIINADFFGMRQSNNVLYRRPLSISLDEYLIHEVESSLPNLLRYEDRNSMAFGVEARVPFLDYRLVEYSFTKARPWRIYQGWTKYILRKAMEYRVPNEILWRKDKVGFGTPQNEWLRSLVNSDNHLFCKGSASEGYINLKTARNRIQKWKEHGRGSDNLIFRLLLLEKWLQIWQQDTLVVS
jgi:asparagine synthase (glutamine-hydrolysing)